MNPRPEYLQKILDNITNAAFDDLAPDAVENVKRRLIDISGCIIGGMYGFKNQELAECFLTGVVKKKLWFLCMAKEFLLSMPDLLIVFWHVPTIMEQSDAM